VSESESKERLLAAAKALMLSQGYAGTTVDSICEKAGLTKGSFYHFFKSKEMLGLAVLEWSLLKGGEILGTGPHTAIKEPLARALAFMLHVEACAVELWSNGCLLGVYASELAETNDRMQATVSRMFSEVDAYFVSELAPLAETAEGRLPSAAELGEQYLTLLEGSIVLAKAYRDPNRIVAALKGFRSNIERALGTPV
jgi:TetR/AcrR family transcriptional repressor of nem operon